MRYAFKLAQFRLIKLLTVVTSSNAKRHGMVVWDEIAAEVALEFPNVQWDKMLVDVMTHRMTQHSQTLDTIVATNLLADILSDVAGALAGSLGVAPTANINPEPRFPSIFEPIHGSAFDITGKGIANPIVTFCTAVKMLEHLGERNAAALIMEGIEYVCKKGILTPDVGGNGLYRGRDPRCSGIYRSQSPYRRDRIAMKNEQAAGILLDIFQHTFDSAWAGPAILANLPEKPRGRCVVIGAGKASAAMAAAVDAAWPDMDVSGVVATRYGYAVPAGRTRINTER